MSKAPIPSAPADLQLIAQLKSRLQYAELRIRVLEEQLRLMRIENYGAGGEKLSHAQMELFALEPVVSEVTVQAESECTPVRSSKDRPCKHPGRQELPANPPRVERVLPCTPDQRVCKSCGKETVVIGYEESSQLDVEPAKYFVLVTKREKRACRSCEELGVVSAPLPPRIIEKCLASDPIVIDTVIGKYCNHTPLYRQSMILERDLGLEISRATLDGWVLKVGELLVPMVAAMRRELISGSYIQADETPVDVQMHGAGGRITKRTSGNTVAPEEAWCSISAWVADAMGRSDSWDNSKAFSKLTAIRDTIRSAGREWYMRLVGLMREGSFSRRCSSIHETQFQLRLSRGWTNCLPLTRKLAVVIGLTERHALRQERAKPLLDDIRSKIEAAQSVALPASALSKACQYALTLWRKLTRFLEYPELELSNNLAENSMRPVALGRKNWIHIGSPQAGPKVAAILSVVESCRRLKVSVRDYLAAVLPGFSDLPIRRLPDLTPAAWIAQHS